MKAKKSVALLLAILTISSAAAMEPARPANPLMEAQVKRTEQTAENQQRLP